MEFSQLPGSWSSPDEGYLPLIKSSSPEDRVVTGERSPAYLVSQCPNELQGHRGEGNLLREGKVRKQNFHSRMGAASSSRAVGTS